VLLFLALFVALPLRGIEFKLHERGEERISFDDKIVNEITRQNALLFPV
jgi:hypothetical protein